MMSNLVTDIISLPLSHKYKIKKLIYVGSSCMYPKNIKNNASPNIILSSSLEETNLHYATSKITGMILCDAFNKQFGTNFITVIPSNYFGPNDDFSKENSHVIPALINKIHKAKKKNKKIIKVWGSGKPIRDFLYVEDMIKALIFLMKNYRSTKPINISSNHIYSIKEITYLLKQIIGYDGKVKFDITKPDGTYFKSLDNSKVKKLGWKHSFTFKESLELTYKWYLGTKINKL